MRLEARSCDVGEQSRCPSLGEPGASAAHLLELKPSGNLPRTKGKGQCELGRAMGI